MYKYFENEIDDVKAELVKMSIDIKKMISDSFIALKERDITKAEAVIKYDEVIDKIEIELEDKCTEIILRHHPLAKDLRFVIVALKMTNELERIADLTVNVSERAIEIADKEPLKPLYDISTIFDIINTMISDTVKAFTELNYELAKKVILTDESINILRDKIYIEILEKYIKPDGAKAEVGLPLIFVAKHFERMGDHCVNIAEDIIYLVSSKVVKHHNEEF
jgi:phosphate transport system protein